jgi:predicted nucleotidyltransferase
MEPKELLKKIAKALDEKGLEYMIIGGQAVLIYGEPRLTKDVDITLGISANGFENVTDIVERLNLKILVQNPKDFVKENFVLPLIDNETGFRVDFIFSFSEYEKTALKRVNRVKIDDVEVRFVSIEDLIIHKMIASRERDIEDVRKILIKNKDIDFEYILNWLKAFESIVEENLTQKFLDLKKKLEDS